MDLTRQTQTPTRPALQSKPRLSQGRDCGQPGTGPASCHGLSLPLVYGGRKSRTGLGVLSDHQGPFSLPHFRVALFPSLRFHDPVTFLGTPLPWYSIVKCQSGSLFKTHVSCVTEPEHRANSKREVEWRACWTRPGARSALCHFLLTVCLVPVWFHRHF